MRGEIRIIIALVVYALLGFFAAWLDMHKKIICPQLYWLLGTLTAEICVAIMLY